VPRATTPVLLALDVDGVILDPQRGGLGSWQTAFGDRFGVDASRLDETLFGATWTDVVTGRRPVESALADALRKLEWDIGVESALQYWFEADFVVEPAVMEEAARWSALGVPLALVSNQEPRRARYLEEHLAPLLAITGTAFSGDLGAVKTQPEFYHRAERRLGAVGLGPAVVFLDDTADNVEAATGQGWTGIHFSRDGEWRTEVGDALGRAVDGHTPAP
jgi:putative hydrolase of the HAD superfamily